MKVDEFRAVLARALRPFAAILTVFAFLAAPVALAQDDELADDFDDLMEAEEDVVDEVVVTGSRLKRDSYTSISPLQVISGQVSREIGQIDPGTILQESTAASGVQFDLTFGAFLTDSGPASTTVDLRGLGSSRTLFLVNGRRLSPSGVEGAPNAPDANLIPASLVQQYDVLLDGASSIYGSDALAGVVNVITRKDFDGLELEVFSNIPASSGSGGGRNTISATWGYNGDRGFVGIGAEYRTIDELTLADRKWTDGCETHAEITTEGEIRTTDVYYENVLGQRSPGDCRITGLAGYMTELGPPQLGSLFYTPGTSNVGIPNYSDYFGFGTVVDTDLDGYADVSFRDYNWNGNDLDLSNVPDVDLTNVMAYGEYTFAGEANITPYFELQFNRRKSDGEFFHAQLFPTVNALNPFNPCNPLGAGVDCGLASDSLLDNPAYAAAFAAVNGLTPAQFRDFGIVNLYTGAVGPVPVRPVAHVRGDRGNNATDVKQERLVVGLKGDMPFMNFGDFGNWSWDLYLTNTESKGESWWRDGVRGDRLDLALGNFSSTGTPCDNDLGVPLSPTAAPGCVPVNMFAPSLYANVLNNDFATQAERDYLVDTRYFNTEYRQSVASFYANGDIFEMPGGDVMFGIGFEYREDEITSIPNEVAGDGLFFGFSADQGAVGEKYTRSFFAELEVPLIAGVKGFQELTANISTHHTKDEYYGGKWTYSGKLAWRPVDSLFIRGTVGTSYRAPNLRENFLQQQTGFSPLTDPCVVPDIAYDPVTGYDPTLDQRSAEVIANCVADPDVDPFTFTNGGIQNYSMEAAQGGSLTLAEEKSESFSASVTWDIPFFTAFDWMIGATYYDIEIRDEIIDPSASYIIADCYTDPEGDSAFCSRITRDPSDSTISLIDRGFLNRDILTARGVDLNMRLEWPTQMFGRAVDLAADFTFNRNLERGSRFVAAGGGGDEIDYLQGEFGYPEWNGRAIFRADVGDWRYSFATRYLSSVEQDADFIDDFDNIFISGNADTCLGPQNGDVDCRDIGFADNYFTSSVSAFYLGDRWTFGVGVSNLFDQEPPLVDGNEIGSTNNVPRGRGYDIFGREVFVNVIFRTD